MARHRRHAHCTVLIEDVVFKLIDLVETGESFSLKQNHCAITWDEEIHFHAVSLEMFSERLRALDTIEGLRIRQHFDQVTFKRLQTSHPNENVLIVIPIRSE